MAFEMAFFMNLIDCTLKLYKLYYINNILKFYIVMYISTLCLLITAAQKKKFSLLAGNLFYVFI